MDDQKPASPARSNGPPVDETAVGAFDAGVTAPVPQRSPLRPATFPYQPGDLVIPGYRLTKRLGSGGFGEVWRAEAPGGMGVAIKILANLGRREGGREFRALQTIKNIRHAHIVPLFGVWLKSTDGHVLEDAEVQAAERRILSTDAQADESGGLEATELIIAMGLGDQTLFDRLRDVKRAGGDGVPLEDLLQWMQEAALALDHFNSRSRRSTENVTAVQHCDIKPQNMLLVGDAVQVCDFGLARAQGEVRATSNTMASLAYAAPEMVRPPYDPSPTTDQYSLAISYIELRTGRLPYAEVSPVGITRAKIDGQLDLSGLEPAETVVLKRALQVDPSKRWQTCVEFVKTLRSAVRVTGSSTERGSRSAGEAAQPTVPVAASRVTVAAVGGGGPAGGGSPARGPRRWAVVIAVGVACCGVAAGYAWWRGRGMPSPSVTVAGPADTTPIPGGDLERAEALERRGDLVGAAAEYAAVHAARPDTLAAILWTLQTKAADSRRFADCIPLLERLERLYAASPAPQLKEITRWDVVNTLAWYLATCAEAGGDAARRSRPLAVEGLRLAGNDPSIRAQSLDTLAAAAAREGDWEEALKRIDEAIAVTPDATQRKDFGERRGRYAQKMPWEQR